MRSGTCAHPACDAEFAPAHRLHRYCCYECRVDAVKIAYRGNRREGVRCKRKTCGKTFSTTLTNQIYCSKRCRLIDYGVVAASPRRACPICKTTFVKQSGIHRYCSTKCQRKARRRREGARRAPCIVCGARLSGEKRVYCSLECARKARTPDKQPRRAAEMRCRICTGVFVTLDGAMSYCSSECAMVEYARRNGAAYQRRGPVGGDADMRLTYAEWAAYEVKRRKLAARMR